ncbi:glycosyl hydrolase [Leeuwenhoekiella aequorea]|uniref:glycoside hydrolase family 26 protein n=1 Tax=Leeuwenhoekiella TaxID=283735 RepID=UPI00048E86DE|nr:glycosyl hydrolase [Leeuwenhoekiella sp. MAR_2009_132]|tara:strand:+ start:1225 stop:2472 length:1248 start_codon:yes stop_codon:yes gene_type:complete
MKKFLLSLLLVNFILVSCSKDEEFLEDPETNSEPPVAEQSDVRFLPSEANSYMVDPSATPETVALFYNLKALSYNNYIVGQQDALSSFYQNNSGMSDMKKLTGSDPGLLGSDFMFITDDENNEQPNNWFYQQEQLIKSKTIEAYDKGMVNIFCWHLREPFEGEVFYTSEMTATQKQNAFKSILPGGENHEYYKQKLQKVASFAKSLTGSDGNAIPIIFRPFHEFDMDFFWWGAAYSTPEEFKELWRFTVEYLRDDLSVTNMLYAFSPDNSYTTKTAYLERYPGDAYVDVVGMDNYGDVAAQNGSLIARANQKLKVVSDLAEERNKIAAFTETGYFVSASGTELASDFYSNNLYKVLTDQDINLGFMMFWQNYSDSYTVPVPGAKGADDFMLFTKKEKTILLNDMPDVYDLPQDNT